MCQGSRVAIQYVQGTFLGLRCFLLFPHVDVHGAKASERLKGALEPLSTHLLKPNKSILC